MVGWPSLHYQNDTTSTKLHSPLFPSLPLHYKIHLSPLLSFETNTPQLFSILMNAPVLVAASLGFGRDIWSIPPANITLALKYLYVAYFAYMLAEMFCQLSILAFYLRIMVVPRQRQAVYLLIAMVLGFGIGNTFAMIFQCTPIRFFWDGWRGDVRGFCGVDVRLFGFVRGGVEIFLDLAILTLPLPMLAGLNMSRKRKAQIMGMFSVGFVITVVSCLRLWSFVKFAQTQNPTCTLSLLVVTFFSIRSY